MYEFAVTPAVTNIRRRGVEISEVSPESLGADMELEAGDRITKVNGRTVRDYLDFRFHTAGETELVLEVRKKNGDDWELELERGEGEDFGLTFEAIVPRRSEERRVGKEWGGGWGGEDERGSVEGIRG